MADESNKTPEQSDDSDEPLEQNDSAEDLTPPSNDLQASSLIKGKDTFWTRGLFFFKDDKSTDE